MKISESIAKSGNSIFTVENKKNEIIYQGQCLPRIVHESTGLGKMKENEYHGEDLMYRDENFIEDNYNFYNENQYRNTSLEEIKGKCEELRDRHKEEEAKNNYIEI